MRRAAAGGAFQATGCGLAVGCLLISLGLFALMAGKGSSGIMSAEMAWLLLTFMLLVVGFFMGLVGGALAGVGAWLGAAHSRRQAQVMAAVLAVGGALLGPFVLRAFLAMEPARRKRRAEPPPVPITVVLPGPVQSGPS